MERPARRKSSLAGSHPAAPTPQREENPPPQGEQRPSTGAAQQSATTPKARTKVGFYADEHDLARARAAYFHLPAEKRPRSWSAFVLEALMARVYQAEAEFNGGQPWPPMAAGELPAGRPIE